ncbi:hypothetical protein EWM64_g3231 [Hericium alpestre]|uniref:Uncharacterized protein n=1 Tax=Hericium alpestre TaxID=135208 RepID=A0A4Z0A0Z3_9AGAM|nr:hypothetical protein EWM64_g3231 [Hericium alpestre]
MNLIPPSREQRQPDEVRGTISLQYRGMRIKGLDSKALDQLPPELLAWPKKRHDKPDLLYHFGFGVSFQQLHDYCVARDLLPNHYHGALTRYAAMVEAAVKEISRLCGAKLYLSTVLHIEYQWVLARYSNHMWHREVLRDRDELNAAGAIQRELGLHEPPKWYRQRVESPCGCFLM